MGLPWIQAVASARVIWISACATHVQRLDMILAAAGTPLFI